MTHRCNKCGAEYESGGFYGGHDYCMSCLLSAKAKDEKRMREEEERKQKAIDDRKKVMRDRMVKEAQEKYRDQQTELKKRRVQEELKRRELAEARRQALEQKNRKRRDLMHTRSYGKGGQAGWNAPAPGSGQTAYDNPGVISLDQQKISRRKLVAKPVEKHEPEEKHQGFAGASFGTMGTDAEQPALSLSLEKELPQALATGKEVELLLVGKNSGSKRLEVELFSTITDATGKAVAAKIEPKKCFIEAGGEAKFNVKFASAAKGELKFEAHLRENAFFIDESEGRSNSVELEARIKGNEA